MHKTQHEINASSFKKALPEIMKLLPDAESAVRAHKGERFDYIIHTKNGNSVGSWAKKSTLGHAAKTGSILTITSFHARG